MSKNYFDHALAIITLTSNNIFKPNNYMPAQAESINQTKYSSDNNKFMDDNQQRQNDVSDKSHIFSAY